MDMSNNMIRIRKTALMLFLVFALTLAMVMPAAATTWTNSTINQGSYVQYVTAELGWFTVSANTSVDHDITFTRTAPATVNAGYYKSSTGSPKYIATMRGTGSTSMAADYVISTAGQYRFFIYNGSSDSITVSRMTVVF